MSGDEKTGSMLRTTDVGRILGCSSDDVIELACKGELKAEKQGRVWRFQEQDVMAYVKRLAKGKDLSDVFQDFMQDGKAERGES